MADTQPLSRPSLSRLAAMAAPPLSSAAAPVASPALGVVKDGGALFELGLALATLLLQALPLLLLPTDLSQEVLVALLLRDLKDRQVNTVIARVYTRLRTGPPSNLKGRETGKVTH